MTRSHVGVRLTVSVFTPQTGSKARASNNLLYLKGIYFQVKIFTIVLHKHCNIRFICRSAIAFIVQDLFQDVQPVISMTGYFARLFHVQSFSHAAGNYFFAAIYACNNSIW
jgi:hypothetical protein